MQAYAKINWTLEVLGKRNDGYHELRSIVLPISLHDDVDLTPTQNGGIVIFGCDGIQPEKNLAFVAASAFSRFTGISPNVHIHIVKRIPAGAGLGGGSSDAAAVIRGLDAMYGTRLPESDLLQMAAQVGSDVPALVLDGPVMMEGRGERVRRLSEEELALVPPRENIEVYTPPIFSSTAEVYAEFRPSDRGLGRNDLQPAALRLHPEIAEALRLLEEKGLADVCLSGSGSSVYGVRP